MDPFEKILADISLLLASKGYDESQIALKDLSNTLMIQIEEGFKKSLLDSLRSKKPESFFAETKSMVGKGEIYLKFHFQFNPKDQKLTIPALYANIGQNEKIFSINKNNELPAKQQVRDWLQNPNKMDRIKKLLTQKPRGPKKRI